MTGFCFPILEGAIPPPPTVSAGKMEKSGLLIVAADMEAGGAKVIVGNQYCEDLERELTVWKTSHFCPGDGFGAYDHRTGELAFRVESYDRGSALNDELELMDAAGACIITLRRKWRTLHSRWEGFLGERTEGQKPLFSVHRHSIFYGGHAGVFAEVHGVDEAGDGPPALEYRVEGSFEERSCRVLNVGEREEEVVAVIRRKMADPCSQVILGRDVFCLYLRPLADAAFIMGLVLVLDRIGADESNIGVSLNPAAEAEGDSE